jgi:hypothetical protein
MHYMVLSLSSLAKKFVLKLWTVNGRATVMDKLWDSSANSGFKETEASKNGVIGFNLLSQFNFLIMHVLVVIPNGALLL